MIPELVSLFPLSLLLCPPLPPPPPPPLYVNRSPETQVHRSPSPSDRPTQQPTRERARGRKQLEKLAPIFPLRLRVRKEGRKLLGKIALVSPLLAESVTPSSFLLARPLPFHGWIFLSFYPHSLTPLPLPGESYPPSLLLPPNTIC